MASRNIWNTEYDFIIVGSGSAGSTLAGRLSEKFSVLLLEAGGAETIVSDMPAMAFGLQGSRLEWNYKIVPQARASFGYKNNQVTHPRGKVLGGTSVINNMNYLRPSPEDVNRWAEIAGDEEWKWDKVLPYFIKAERNLDPRMLENGRHGNNGPVTYYTPPSSLLFDTLREAANELKYPPVYDINGPNSELGYAQIQKNIKNGKRGSMATTYLKPIYKTRKNLAILAKAFVYKIQFEAQSSPPKAYGVWFINSVTT